MEEMKFEEAIGRLEKIVQQLEEGEKSLEDSLKLFEEGIKLSKFCSGKLEEAKKKIEILTKSDKGEAVTKPFNLEEEIEEEETDS
ncbi:exodeoxyribonuclease VII small subunit [bacterium]|nr:exodeoxyribonuclease VII small subunit [bacterium]NIN91977.1 exodeoxyribonuclease VII small subunit [bacterium]NIO18193.1 exodeoxyribonuclease VII small subunit [bacterium]NIO73167.1 exodeoxyribonuclease VII small subunit [bacterium]